MLGWIDTADPRERAALLLQDRPEGLAPEAFAIEFQRDQLAYARFQQWRLVLHPPADGAAPEQEGEQRLWLAAWSFACYQERLARSVLAALDCPVS